MNSTFARCALALSACALSSLSTQGLADESGPQGSLLAVGGALESSNTEVYEAFIELAGGEDKANIGILPAASGKPSKYARLFEEDLIRYGLSGDQVELIPIAVKDDSSTNDLDESTWIGNASDEALAETVAGYTGIWFVGGDQTRITKALLPNGERTPVLNALHSLYNNGGVIGGTSAGAAMMSDVMIASGDSLGALLNGFTEEYGSMDEQESGPVHASSGLGFFSGGVIDQHFDRKARLGRLIAVNHHYRNDYPLGFGIDENSAMIYWASNDTIEAIGYGGVTVVDVRDMNAQTVQGLPHWTGIRLSFLQGGDRYQLSSDTFTINEKKYDTVGYEYINVPNPMNTGVFSRNPNYKDLISYDLVDNKAATEVVSYDFNADGRGFKVRFYQDDQTTGWWNYLDGLKDNYSAVRVLMDITPVEVTVSELE